MMRLIRQEIHSHRACRLGGATSQSVTDMGFMLAMLASSSHPLKWASTPQEMREMPCYCTHRGEIVSNLTILQLP